MRTIIHKNNSIATLAIFLILVVYGFTSCNIKEDLSNCPGSILLDYTDYSQEILDEIDPTSMVYIYIFDTEDICTEIMSYTYGELEAIDFEFSVPRVYNGNNALIWHGVDDPDYDNSSMVKGALLDDFYLKLIHETSNFSEVTPLLWASELEPIEYCSTKTRHRIYMTRVHTLINLKLTQVNNDNTITQLDMNDYIVSLNAKNDIYHEDFTIDEESTEVIYTNLDEISTVTLAEELEITHVGTLRLTPDMESLLTIRRVDDGTIVTIGGAEGVDIIDYMLETKSDSDTNSEQRFLDLNKVWDIELMVDSYEVALAITINGWTQWFDSKDLN